ncbi:glycoside hydrolase family protein [Microvirga lenta]|uniref:hypothetical protein n=1 Tax=Microvirga lenta TaxID=2881337 RepID=UPI001CFF7674|nr:hypothetical protein [Microvirga lenta]MCB5175193.1 hypothetical protein [Microvirga lenta]
MRVYFSTRDVEGRSHLASIDIALDGSRFEILSAPSGPLLSPGPRGSFDADGVTVTSLIRRKDKILAYYLGWTVGKSVPFTNTIGLAIADQDAPAFSRRFNIPVVGRSEANPLTLGYPWVTEIDDGYRMWFGSHLSWGEGWMDMIHVVKSAISRDGEVWESESGIVIPLAGAAEPQEFAVSRPVVLRGGGGWSMWYARRFAQYKLGYAWSSDGRNWIRRDHLVSFTRSPEEWESDARTYPCVFEHRGRIYMLYNGNGYGREGFGIALLNE